MKSVRLFAMSASIAVLFAAQAMAADTLIQNKGSDTLVNVAQAWAEEYKSVDPAVAVAVVTAFTTQPRALTCHCDCGGYSPLAAAVRRLAKTGNVGQVESFVRGVPGLGVYVEKEVRRADEQSTETKYTAHWATGHHLVTWTVEEPAKHNRCAQPKDD